MSLANRRLALGTVILCLILLLAGAVELLERHDHGVQNGNHTCPACRLAESPGDLPTPDLDPSANPLADPGDIIPVFDIAPHQRAGTAPPHLRGPPEA